MALMFNNLNPAITDEKPKHELVKDEDAIADVALLRGQTVQIVTNALGEMHVTLAAAGARAFVVMEAVAAGGRVRMRFLGHAPVVVNAVLPAGTLLMADGAGGAIAHVGQAWYLGHSEWPSQQVGHLIAVWVERGYR
jgi:hypothetical protein